MNSKNHLIVKNGINFNVNDIMKNVLRSNEFYFCFLLLLLLQRG